VDAVIFGTAGPARFLRMITRLEGHRVQNEAGHEQAAKGQPKPLLIVRCGANGSTDGALSWSN